LIAIVLAPLAGCVAPTVVSDYQRVARIDDVSVRPIYGQTGVYEVTVRGTADGSGWSAAELRVVGDPGARGEMTLAMFARPPEHVVSRGYNPARAYGGDTYYPPETSRWPSGRPAVDTYFGGGDPLEAQLVVNPGTDQRILRVVGQANESGGHFDTLASTKLGGPRQMRRHEWYLSRRPLLEIGSGDYPIVSWNGEPLVTDAALEAKLREIASRPEPIEVRVRPNQDASYARVTEVMTTLSRYGISARIVGDRRSRGDPDDSPVNTDPTQPPSDGFFFTRGH
jgi:hypothetical protein